MAITQDFKNNCDKLINDWKNLVYIKNENEATWEQIALLINQGKGRILEGDFFRECWRWNGEQRAYFYNLLAVVYVNHPVRDQINYVSANTNRYRTGWTVLEMTELAFNWFSKCKADMWADVGQYNQALIDKGNAERARDQAQADKATTETVRNQALTDKTTAEKQRDQALSDKAIAEKAGDTAKNDLTSKIAELKTANDNITSLNNQIKVLEADKTALNIQVKTKDGTISTLTNYLSAANYSLNSWTSTFKDKTPEQLKGDIDKLTANQERHRPEELEQHKPEDLKPTDLPADWREQLAKLPTLEANQKPADYETIKNQLATANNSINTLTNEKNALGDKLKEKDGEINSLNSQIETLKKQPQPQPSPQADQYLNKLLELYKIEIKKRSELFYQELSIDNNKINAQYGSPSISYLELLKNLKGESEPEQVINSFKIVALIIATQKSQEESDKLSKLSKVPPQLKRNKLEYFARVKENWDLITQEPSETNNPFYLPIVKERVKYIQQINDIIKLWQNK